MTQPPVAAMVWATAPPVRNPRVAATGSAAQGKLGEHRNWAKEVLGAISTVMAQRGPIPEECRDRVKLAVVVLRVAQTMRCEEGVA